MSDKNCPVQRGLKIFDGKWNARVLYELILQPIMRKHPGHDPQHASGCALRHGPTTPRSNHCAARPDIDSRQFFSETTP